MGRRDWSEEKRKVFSFERNICVSAGAGSGKTAALVELDSRFISGETPLGKLKLEQILAITFTEKAAAEMKERIRAEIDERLLSEQDPDRLDLWMEARRALLSASISTFHSFCARVLREHPLEAILDPRFEVAREEQARDLLAETAQRLLYAKLKEEAASPHEPRDAMSTQELMLDFTFPALRSALVATLTALRSAGGEPERLEGLLPAQEREAQEALDKAKGELSAAFACALDLLACEDVKKSKLLFPRLSALASSRESLAGTIARLSADSRDEELSLVGEISLAFKGNVPKAAKGLKEELKALLDDSAGAIPLLVRFFRAVPTQRAMARLVAALDEAYTREKRSLSLVDFEDLLRLCRDLLRDNPAVRREYKRAYKVLLVDEFQDTNELQREIVYLLAEKGGEEQLLAPGEPVEALPLEPRKLFVVGDAKQSIYFFRGADVEVFSSVMADVAKKGGEIISFQENFRTLDSILEVINPLFASLMQGGEEGFHLRFAPRDHLLPRRTTRRACGSVELLFTVPEGQAEGQKLNALQRRRLEADALARRILLLTDEESGLLIGAPTREGGEEERVAGFGDVAILMRSLTQVRIYEEALRRSDIPYHLVRGRGFYGCQEVRDVLHVLKLLAGVETGVSLAGILRSPLVGCSDETLLRLALSGDGRRRDMVGTALGDDLLELPCGERRKVEKCRGALQRLMALKDRLTLRELVEEIIASFAFAEVLVSTYQGEQKAANLRKLAGLAGAYEGRGVFSLQDFVRHLERKVEEESYEAEALLSEEGASAVRIMSIHQAKGLEFPVVIVPDLGRGEFVDHPAVHYSVKRGLSCRYRDVASGEARDHWFYRLMGEERLARERAESFRLLYVALTRARDCLVLSGSPVRATDDSWRNLVERFLGAALLEKFMLAPDEDVDTALDFAAPELPRSYHFNVRLLKSTALRPRARTRGDAAVELLPAALNPSSPGSVEKIASFSAGEPRHPDGDAAIDRVLSWRTPRPCTVTLTPTSLMIYRLCPRKYLYDSLLSRGEGFHGALLTEVRNENLREAQGWAAHKALEEIDFTMERRGLEKRLERQLLKIGEGETLLSRKTKGIMDAVLRLIDAPPARRLGLMDAGTLLFREHPFMLRLPGDSRSGAPDVFLRGRIDLIGRNPAGAWFLLDYKYARREEETLLDYPLQVLVYALALRLGAAVTGLSSSLVYLQEDPVAFVDVPTGEEQLLAAATLVQDMARGMLERHEEGGEAPWEKTERRNCRAISCPYVRRCWHEQGGC